MPVASSKARPLRCVTVGEGRPLVLLHGYAMQPETYLPLARRLADISARSSSGEADGKTNDGGGFGARQACRGSLEAIKVARQGSAA